MATIITVDEQGSVTLPDDVRKRLRLRGRASLTVELREDGVLLRPVEAPSDSAGSAPQVDDSQVVRNISRAYLYKLIRRADEANASGRDVTADEIASWLEEGEVKGLLERAPATPQIPDDAYRTPDLGPRFIASLLRRDFSATERQRFARALDVLDENERHPSLRVHKLEGVDDDLCSASVSNALRITFRRLPGGRKLLVECSRHYDR